jgi:hypothetical protein
MPITNKANTLHNGMCLAIYIIRAGITQAHINILTKYWGLILS